MFQYFSLSKFLILPLNGSLASMHISFQKGFQPTSPEIIMIFLILSIQVSDIVIRTNVCLVVQKVKK